MGRARAMLTGMTVGALAGYLLDPASGRTRRAQLRDRMVAMRHRAERTTQKQIRHMASDGEGMVKRMRSAMQPTTTVDDVQLVQRIRSEVFGSEGFPKGEVVIDAQDGYVAVRGAIGDPEERARIEERIKQVPGVRGVMSVLHDERSPAPNKESALEASEAVERPR